MLGGLLNGAVSWPLFAGWTSLMGLWLLVVYPFDPTGRRAWRALNVIWGRALWFWNPLWSLQRDGEENLPDGPCILVGNHVSVLDIPALLGFPIHTTVVSSPRLYKAPVIGPFMTISRQICSSDFFEEGPVALKNGISLIVFAEGGRSPDGNLGRFRMGAFRLSRQTGVPIVPVAVSGSDQLLGKHGRVPKRLFVRVRVRALPAVSPADYDSDRAMLTDVRARIAAELESL